MNVARVVMIAVPLGIVLIYFVMQSLTVGVAAHRDLVEDGKLMEDIRMRQLPGLYDVIETGFPDEYAEHVDEIEEIALDTDVARHDLGPELMAESDSFVAALRAENAEHVRNADRDPLLEIQRAQLVLLKGLSGSPALCLRVAKGGLSGLSRVELSQIEPDVHGRWLTAQFKAMAVGRDAPETFEKPSENDWRIFLQGWREAEGEMTPAMEAYLWSNEEDPGLYCEGAIGFARRLIADTTPSGLRILADYTASLAR